MKSIASRAFASALIALIAAGCSKSDAQDANQKAPAQQKSASKDSGEQGFLKAVRTNDNDNSVGSINTSLSVFFSNYMAKHNSWAEYEKASGVKHSPMDIVPFKVFDVKVTACTKSQTLKFMCKADFVLDFKGYKKQLSGYHFLVEPTALGVPQVDEISEM